MRVRVATPGDAAVLVEFSAAMARETEQKELLPEVIGAGVRALLANPDGFRLYVDRDNAAARRARTARSA